MPRAPVLVLSVLLAAATAGCLEIPAARVPADSLEAKNWRENATSAHSGSSWGGLVRSEQRGFEHASGSDGYAGHLGVVTIRAFLEQSEEDLRDRLQETVRAQSEAKGIEIAEDAEKGARTNADGRATQWFTYRGTAKSADTLFTRNAEVRIVGEVWNCRESRSVVIAVGLAQVNDVRTIGGIAVPRDPDFRTWQSLIADPEGTIEDVRGTGLLDSIVCG